MSDRRHVNAARFVRDPRVAQLSDEQCAQFVKEKLGYSFKKSLMFVKQCRSSERIGEMLERAAPAYTSSGRAREGRPTPAQMVRHGYPNESRYTCGDGYHTTKPDVQMGIGPNAVYVRPEQKEALTRAHAAIAASYGTPAYATNTGCCGQETVAAIAGAPMPNACTSLDCQECVGDQAAAGCSRQIIQCTASLCREGIAAPEFAYDDLCNENNFDYCWMMLDFSKNGMKQTQFRTGYFRQVSCGINHYRDMINLVACDLYDQVLATPYGAKVPAFCDKMLMGHTLDGHNGSLDVDQGKRFQERAIPAFAKWCFGGGDEAEDEPVLEPRATDSGDDHMELTYDDTGAAEHTGPTYCVAVTHHDISYMLESLASNMAEYVSYKIASGLYSDDTYTEVS